jgi:hypothetical protein
MYRDVCLTVCIDVNCMNELLVIENSLMKWCPILNDNVNVK